MSSEIISKTYTDKVWVTKLNPTKWGNKSHDKRWFTSLKELKEGFVRGDFDQMIVFRHCGGELPFGKFLKEIILDDPQLVSEEGIDGFSMAYGALRISMGDSGINAEISKRVCRPECVCKQFYKDNLGWTKKMYVPDI